MILDSYGREIPPEMLARRAAPGRELREDRWENYATGIGTVEDKSQHGRFFPIWRIMDPELKDLYNGSDLAAMVVEEPPKETFREGFDLLGHIPGPDQKGKGEPVLESDVRELRSFASEELQLEEQFVQAHIFGRLFGGCLLVMGIDDGGFPWEPLNEDRIRSFDYISLIDRRYAYVQSQYSGMDRKKYGQAEIYLISNAVAGTGWNDHGVVRAKSVDELRGSGASIQLIHESRVIRFDGNPADVQTRQRLAGWSWSVLQRLYDAMRQFEHAFDSVGYLLSDASQGVLKMFGLMKAISAGRRQEFEARMMLLDRGRSAIRSLLLDAGDKDRPGEEFTRVQTPLSGIADIMDRMMMRFAAAARMPQTKLFGRSPAGLNATGESDIRNWYDQLRTHANTATAPKLARVFRLLTKARPGPLRNKDVRWEVTFRPLWSPTDDEVAKTQFSQAQTAQIYLQEGVLSPEVVALTLKDEYPALDTEAIEASLEAKTSFDPHENDPEPPIPGNAGEQLSPSTPVQTIGKSAGPQIEGAAPTGTPPKAKEAGPGPKKKPAKPLPPQVAATPQKAMAPSGGVHIAIHTGAPPKAKAASDRADSLERLVTRADAIADAVHQQLAQDYPEDAIDWTKGVEWKLKRVKPSRIDFTNADKWQASHEPEKVAKHIERISQGVEKPIILLKLPGQRLLSIPDGHHRALGYRALDKNARAYVGKVHAAHGPWDAMHARQKETGLEASTQSQREETA